ncbi:phage major capsid protein [Macrococcoides caseolyticum]|uniref:N4-gp56 family major capsid protein n=1 Tax=Macrococcoides caseolyticum TaxID=69966 RepID=A0ACC9MUC1_9STAP|nr:phage major capsid protein [Macrococcus caseolyticus]PKE57279.1 N4-gp56 family major capsid protein [Macrococcus caseolyticus]PKF14011.1 N4-gp56 family major capsid protein [Macrococcus caseolyticus]PKF21653.1 N4-gp56 family major capsid protein [Macrococcus caseolyticus]PKF35651.1 N4-gp56 family major capsid protein [Macrococcus caseolyticus]QYA35965.1 phage major capsid protein [Macrococcus caseolyticus]
MATTKQTNLVIPEVMATIIQAELNKKIRFAPIADVDTTLVGQPGNKVSVPAYKYIGDATVIPEGEPIPLDLLEAVKKEMEIKKVGKGVELTDEAILAAIGDPKGEAARQIALAIANAIDNFLLEAAKTTTVAHVGDVKLIDTIDNAIAKFGDEELEPMVLFVNPSDAGALRKAAADNWTRPSDLGDTIVTTGVFGELLGAEVVRTKKLAVGEALLVKKGALKLFLKRDTLVETDRDIIRKTTVITGDKHFGAYLYNDAKAVKITSA